MGKLHKIITGLLAGILMTGLSTTVQAADWSITIPKDIGIDTVYNNSIMKGSGDVIVNNSSTNTVINIVPGAEGQVLHDENEKDDVTIDYEMSNTVMNFGKSASPQTGQTEYKATKQTGHWGSEKDYVIYSIKTYNDNQCVVTFDPNGGSTPVLDGSVYTGFVYDKGTNKTYGKLPSTTRKNYELVGWYTEPETGSGTKIGTAGENSSTVIGDTNVTLYAHWGYRDDEGNLIEGEPDVQVIWQIRDDLDPTKYETIGNTGVQKMKSAYKFPDLTKYGLTLNPQSGWYTKNGRAIKTGDVILGSDINDNSKKPYTVYCIATIKHKGNVIHFQFWSSLFNSDANGVDTYEFNVYDTKNEPTHWVPVYTTGKSIQYIDDNGDVKNITDFTIHSNDSDVQLLDGNGTLRNGNSSGSTFTANNGDNYVAAYNDNRQVKNGSKTELPTARTSTIRKKDYRGILKDFPVGYEFLGWALDYKEMQGTTKVYQPGDILTNDSTYNETKDKKRTLVTDITTDSSDVGALYSRWELAKYMCRYNVNQEQISQKQQSIGETKGLAQQATIYEDGNATYDVEYTYTCKMKNVPAYPDVYCPTYHFVGWNLKKDGTGMWLTQEGWVDKINRETGKPAADAQYYTKINNLFDNYAYASKPFTYKDGKTYDPIYWMVGDIVLYAQWDKMYKMEPIRSYLTSPGPETNLTKYEGKRDQSDFYLPGTNVTVKSTVNVNESNWKNSNVTFNDNDVDQIKSYILTADEGGREKYITYDGDIYNNDKGVFDRIYSTTDEISSSSYGARYAAWDFKYFNDNSGGSHAGDSYGEGKKIAINFGNGKLKYLGLEDFDPKDDGKIERDGLTLLTTDKYSLLGDTNQIHKNECWHEALYYYVSGWTVLPGTGSLKADLIPGGGTNDFLKFGNVTINTGNVVSQTFTVPENNVRIRADIQYHAEKFDYFVDGETANPELAGKNLMTETITSYVAAVHAGWLDSAKDMKSYYANLINSNDSDNIATPTSYVQPKKVAKWLKEHYSFDCLDTNSMCPFGWVGYDFYRYEKNQTPPHGISYPFFGMRESVPVDKYKAFMNGSYWSATKKYGDGKIKINKNTKDYMASNIYTGDSYNYSTIKFSMANQKNSYYELTFYPNDSNGTIDLRITAYGKVDSTNGNRTFYNPNGTIYSGTKQHAESKCGRDHNGNGTYGESAKAAGKYDNVDDYSKKFKNKFDWARIDGSRGISVDFFSPKVNLNIYPMMEGAFEDAGGADERGLVKYKIHSSESECVKNTGDNGFDLGAVRQESGKYYSASNTIHAYIKAPTVCTWKQKAAGDSFKIKSITGKAI